MSILNKIFALWMAGQSLTDHSRLVRNFLSNIAVILSLLLITTIMTGTLLIGGVYAGYLALLANGFTAYAALSIIGGVLLFFIVILGFFLVARFKQLRRIPSIMQSSPLTSRVSEVGNAFMDGLLKRTN